MEVCVCAPFWGSTRLCRGENTAREEEGGVAGSPTALTSPSRLCPRGLSPLGTLDHCADGGSEHILSPRHEAPKSRVTLCSPIPGYMWPPLLTPLPCWALLSWGFTLVAGAGPGGTGVVPGVDPQALAEAGG